MSFRLMWKSVKYNGVWEMSANSEVHKALTNKYLESIGFPSMLMMYEEAHSRLLNRRIRRVRTVV